MGEGVPGFSCHFRGSSWEGSHSRCAGRVGRTRPTIMKGNMRTTPSPPVSHEVHLQPGEPLSIAFAGTIQTAKHL